MPDWQGLVGSRATQDLNRIGIRDRSIALVFYTTQRLEWQIPECGRLYERLAEKRMLIRYDGRGSGLSDRDVTDFTIDAL